MIKIKGGITAPDGFLASGINSGVKRKNPDLALLYSEENAVCVGFFTKNRVKAAPVVICLDKIKNAFHRAVVVNSGCANCLTGKIGIINAQLITKKLSELLCINNKMILPCSTGIIGEHLQVEKINRALPLLVKNLSKHNSVKMAKAIMTTDKFVKTFACCIKAGNKKVKIGGVAKGAGMIAPNMATTICIITTDAGISKPLLRSVVADAVNNSFNSVTVDGDTSTNDTLLCFANAASGIKIKKNTKAYKEFKEAINYTAFKLAKMLVLDGEGATKIMDIVVSRARTGLQAKTVAFGIADSNLVKTAVFGQDPNIGRIASACGASGADIDQNKLDIYIENKKVVKNGVINPQPGLKHIFKKKEIQIKCELNLGKAWHRVLASDLSHEYVSINAEYS